MAESSTDSSEAFKPPRPSRQRIKRKIVFIGSKTSGKTCFIQRYLKNIFKEDDYDPTVFDTDKSTLQVGSALVDLELWDTSGQDSYDRVRPLAYNNVNIICLCFNLVDKKSFHAVREKWYPEVAAYIDKCNVKLFLLGMKEDLVTELPSICVRQKQIAQLQKDLHCEKTYFSCSSKENRNITEAVNQAVRKSLETDYGVGIGQRKGKVRACSSPCAQLGQGQAHAFGTGQRELEDDRQKVRRRFSVSTPKILFRRARFPSFRSELP